MHDLTLWQDTKKIVKKNILALINAQLSWQGKTKRREKGTSLNDIGETGSFACELKKTQIPNVPANAFMLSKRKNENYGMIDSFGPRDIDSKRDLFDLTYPDLTSEILLQETPTGRCLELKIIAI